MKGDVQNRQLSNLALPAVAQSCKADRFQQSILNPTSPIVSFETGAVPTAKGACKTVGADVWDTDAGSWISVPDTWRRSPQNDDKAVDATGDTNNGYGWHWGWSKDNQCSQSQSNNGHVPQGTTRQPPNTLTSL